MTPALAVLILASVSSSAIAQISLKLAMSSLAVQAALAQPDRWFLAKAIGLSPWFMLGIGLYGLGALIWLFVLARLDVSVAYPFVSLGFLLTMALGCILLGEPFTPRKLAGTVVVMCGIWLVART